MLSTLHLGEIVNTGKHDLKAKQFIMKPKCIVDFSCKMGVVDWTDMLLSCVRSICKSEMVQAVVTSCTERITAQCARSLHHLPSTWQKMYTTTLPHCILMTSSIRHIICLGSDGLSECPYLNTFRL
jgi:hypothetical protein